MSNIRSRALGHQPELPPVIKQLAKLEQELAATRHAIDAQLALGRSANRAVLRKLMEVEERLNDRADTIRRDQFKEYIQNHVTDDFLYNEVVDSKIVDLYDDNHMETLAARFRSFAEWVVKQLLPDEDAASLVDALPEYEEEN